ncbi:hypothetical protein IBX73_05060 [candidate division WOR-3 bacterium]|nr:hypothetical protein [candidate division WOR-3 bacterium]
MLVLSPAASTIAYPSAAGAAGMLQGRGEGYTIGGDYKTHASFRPWLIKNAVSQIKVPPELKKSAEDPTSQSEP